MIITQAVELPDVSYWQGVIDFNKMGNSVILRAGHGAYVDAQFERNRSEAVSRGMNWGIYWFYDDRISPIEQSKKLFSLFSSGQPLPTMEIWCDWETTYSGNYGKLSDVVLFMKTLESLFPNHKIGLYTGYYWITPKMTSSYYDYFYRVPLWLAWYTTNPANVQIPKPWTKVTFWQYGTPVRGQEFGVQSLEIDMSWFNGTAQEFSDRYSGTVVTPPPPPPTGGTVLSTYKTLVQVKAYASNSFTSAPAGLVGNGAIFDAEPLVDGWLKRTDGRYVNIMKGTTVAIQLVSTPPPPPPPTLKITGIITIYENGTFDVQRF